MKRWGRSQRQGFVTGIIISVLGFSLVGQVSAALVGKTIEVYTGVEIYVDDMRLDPKDANGNPVEAFIYNGTTYLPVRAVGEAVGKTVQWEGKSGSVYLGKHSGDSPAILLQDLDYYMGSKLKTANGAEKDNLGQARTGCIIDSYINNTYRLNGQYRLLTGTFFQRYEHRGESWSSSYFKIYGDGKLLYEATMAGGIDPIDFSVDLTGVLELTVKLNMDGYTVYSGISNCGLWT